MASNSYYGGDNGSQQQQQVGYDQNANASYGASYGQQQQQQPSYEQGGYGASQSGGGGGQTYADQVYADGSRDQQYDASGNPVLPNGERGLLTDLAGAGAGAFLGHKAGHGFLGAIAGGIGAHLLGDAMKKPSYGRPGGMFGRRDMDDSSQQAGDGQGYGQVDQQYQQSNQQYAGYPSSTEAQNQGPAYGQAPYDQNQTYGQNYGQ